MDPFFEVVERKIEQAERDGLFADLPGRGRPLVLDDLSGVPPELRASYILLRSQGFLPPELEARKEWLRLEDLLAACADEAHRPRLRRDTQKALLRYRLLMARAGHRQGMLDYREELLQRLGGAPTDSGSS